MARQQNGPSTSWMRQFLPDAALLFGLVAVLVFAIVVIVVKPAVPHANTRRTPIANSSPSSSSSQVPTATAKKAAPVAVFIGDSYTTGVGGGGTKWTTVLAHDEGWREVNIGNRGTGYAQTYAGSECPQSKCPNYLQVVSKAVAAKPDIVVVSGGRNDLADQPNAVANIPTLFQEMRRQLPTVRIIAISPFWGVSSYPSSLKDLGAKIGRAVDAVNGTYLDVGPVLSNKTDLVTDGGSFPNADGYKSIASAVEAALKKS